MTVEESLTKAIKYAKYIAEALPINEDCDKDVTDIIKKINNKSQKKTKKIIKRRRSIP